MQYASYNRQQDPMVGSQFAGGVVRGVEYRTISGGSYARGSVAPSVGGLSYSGMNNRSVMAPQQQPSVARSVPRSFQERDYPVDLVQPPYNHVPSGDGFTSPYETLPHNVNRNPFYKSWYDVPGELRHASRPPQDFVISQHDPDYLPLLHVPDRDADSFVARQAGISNFRFRIMGQRQEELKDNGPAVQMADFQIFDMENAPYPMDHFRVGCSSEGICDEGCEPERLLDGEPGTKFLRRDFRAWPIELEFDFGRPIPIGSYSWRTANDTPGRDPVSWQLQALVMGQWIVVDEVEECTVPKARYAQVGPFGLANMPFENVPASEHYEMEPPMHVPLYHLDQDEPSEHYHTVPGPTTLSMPVTMPPDHSQQVAVPFTEPIALTETGLKVPEGVNPQATVILHDILVQPNVDRFPARVQELLRKGADAISPDTKGRTPLIKACRKGDPSVLTMLLDYGAEVNARTHAGETPLHRLALNGDVQCVETLLRAGGDPNLPDGQGDTALALATARADAPCVALMLRAGGRADLRNFKNLTGLDMLEEEVRRQGYETAAAREVRRLLGHGAGPIGTRGGAGDGPVHAGPRATYNPMATVGYATVPSNVSPARAYGLM